MTGRLRHYSPRGASALLALGLAGALATACGGSSHAGSLARAAGTSASSLAPIHGTYSPKIDPANFVATIDNRYFPLKPGTAFHYKGVQRTGRLRRPTTRS